MSLSGVTGGCAGNLSQVLWKNKKHSQSLRHLFSPSSVILGVHLLGLSLGDFELQLHIYTFKNMQKNIEVRTPKHIVKLYFKGQSEEMNTAIVEYC